MIVKENASYVTRDGMYISDRQELETEQGNQMPLRPNNGPTKRRKSFAFVSRQMSNPCLMHHASRGSRKKEKRKLERDLQTRLVTNGVFQQQMTHDYSQLDIVYR